MVKTGKSAKSNKRAAAVKISGVVASAKRASRKAVDMPVNTNMGVHRSKYLSTNTNEGYWKLG